MFIIDGAGNLLRIRRRPRDWEHRETEEDCRFIAENRRWDGDDRESVAKAIGLYDVMPNATSINERWLKQPLVRHGDPKQLIESIQAARRARDRQRAAPGSLRSIRLPANSSG
jgi:hypothetical protein